jgi:hypothetical protein
MHFAKPVLAKFSAHPEQIELVTRPSSSPQLNPTRRFWKHVRRKVTHHTFFQTIDRLLDAVTEFLRDSAAHPATERTVCGQATMSRRNPVTASSSRSMVWKKVL